MSEKDKGDNMYQRRTRSTLSLSATRPTPSHLTLRHLRPNHAREALRGPHYPAFCVECHYCYGPLRPMICASARSINEVVEDVKNNTANLK